METSEETLAEWAAHGDRDAYAILVERHKERVVALCARHVPPEEVADAAQDSFVKAWTGLASFRPTAEGGFSRWLTTICVNRCRDYWRTQTARRAVVAVDFDASQWLREAMAAEACERQEHLARRQEAREAVGLLLDHVAPDDRMVLGLQYVEGYTMDEIATHMGWSLSKTKVRAHRAKMHMREVARQLTER